MKTFFRMKFATIICTLCLFAIGTPQSVMAQRFSHGGGGFRGGGGAPRSAPVMRGGSGERPAPAFGGRSINGGGRNIGAHIFGRPAPAPAFRGERLGGGFHNEGIYHHVYGSRPYFYHPYHPYMWGPYWHPFGFFCATLTADAILFSIANQQYYYDNGVYYEPSGTGYTVVPPPIGAVVSYLPAGYMTVQVGEAVYYYFGGAFYIMQGNNSYRVVPAPVGAIVTQIPEGATEQVINGQNYLLYNNTYYQPISQNGQDAYEVVQVN